MTGPTKKQSGARLRDKQRHLTPLKDGTDAGFTRLARAPRIASGRPVKEDMAQVIEDTTYPSSPSSNRARDGD